MKQYYKVTFQHSENVFCTNLAHAETVQDVEREYSVYSWSSIKPAQPWDVEEARVKGMPIIEIEPAPVEETEQAEETEQTEETEETKEEVKPMKKYNFTPETLTACGPNFPEGRTFPARYEIQDQADMKRGQAVPVVHIFAVVDEKEIKIDVPGDDEWYYEAFKAATEAAELMEAGTETQEAEPVEIEQAETVEQTETEQAAETVEAAPVELEQAETVEQTETEQAAETVEAEPVELEQAETVEQTETQEPETVEAVEDVEPVKAEPVKVERRPAGDKSFIGTVIEGERYRIVFDSETQRTRVFIPAEYREAARGAVEGAGFYWSGNMQSFNKKLTCKAYRAAVALAAELDKTLTA